MSLSQILRKLAPALLAIIASVGLVAAQDQTGLAQSALYFITAIAIGGLVGAARFDG